MLMTSQCTVYTRVDDVSPYRRQSAQCHWQDTRGITFTGGENATLTANDVFVMIPLESMELPVVSSKDRSQNYIVRGIAADEVTPQNVGQKMQDLNGLTIKAIDRNDYSIGIADNHWAVYAV